MPRPPMIASVGDGVQRVKSPAAYQAFQNPLVNRTFFDSLSKIEKRSERAGLARFHDRRDAVYPDAFDGLQTVPAPTLERSAADVAFATVRRPQDVPGP